MAISISRVTTTTSGFYNLLIRLNLLAESETQALAFPPETTKKED